MRVVSPSWYSDHYRILKCKLLHAVKNSKNALGILASWEIITWRITMPLNKMESLKSQDNGHVCSNMTSLEISCLQDTPNDVIYQYHQLAQV